MQSLPKPKPAPRLKAEELGQLPEPSGHQQEPTLQQQDQMDFLPVHFQQQQGQEDSCCFSNQNKADRDITLKQRNRLSPSQNFMEEGYKNGHQKPGLGEELVEGRARSASSEDESAQKGTGGQEGQAGSTRTRTRGRPREVCKPATCPLCD